MQQVINSIWKQALVESAIQMVNHYSRAIVPGVTHTFHHFNNNSH